MKRLLTPAVLSFLLSISILFNLFFLLGFAQSRASIARTATHESKHDARGLPADDAVRMVADSLALDDAQQALFASLHRSVVEDRADVRRGEAIFRQRLMETLERQDIDPAEVRELVLRQLDAERRHRAFAAQRFTEFLGALDDDQRIRMRRTMTPRETAAGPRAERDHRGTGDGRPRRPGVSSRTGSATIPENDPPRWLLDRFDHDGDGRLNDAERAEAERFLEERRRERELRRAELMRRFDVDGDGRLNAEEREAMRRWLQEQRESNGDGTSDE